MADENKELPLKLTSVKVEMEEVKKEPKKENPDDKLINEIISIIIIMIGILVLISMLSKEPGRFGQVIKDILINLFGSGAAFFPLVIVSVGLFFWAIKQKIKKVKFLYAMFAYIVFLSLLTIIKIEKSLMLNKSFLELFYLGLDKSGGLIGSLLSAAIMVVIGKSGGIIFSISLLVILFILITGKSFFGLVIFFWLIIKKKIKDEFFNFKHRSSEDDSEDYDDEPVDIEEGKVSSKKRRNFIDIIADFLNDDDILLEDDLEDEYITIEEDAKTPSTKKTTEIDKIDEDNIKEHELPNLFYSPQEFQKYDRTELIEMENDEEDIYEPAIPTKSNIINLPLQSFNENNFIEIPINSNLAEVPIPGKQKSVIKRGSDYIFPSILLLNKNPQNLNKTVFEHAEATKRDLQNIFVEYKVDAKVVKYFSGPTVTRYEISPGQGVKVSRISGLIDEIALKLAAPGVRIEAPIPGKAAVGIEIPNKEPVPVFLRELVDSQEFRRTTSKISFAVGKDIEGNVVVWDIKEMPHLLIAGATGAGKSVCINTLIISILYKANPEEVKLLMIDPKVVELSVYNGVPHLLIPVVTDPKKAAGALVWAVRQMTDRYKIFSEEGVRGIDGYNELQRSRKKDIMPQIVIIIDELSDLMQTSTSEVEDSIKRLSQMARAAGIYLIIATQRPSVDVITGVIKANIPSRLAFAVSSGTDSRTILDMHGAEKLLGKGDMLFYPKGLNKPKRVQGAFISDKEVEKIVYFLKSQNIVTYSEDMIEEITSPVETITESNDTDPLFKEAVEFVVNKEKASASLLQRQFRIGYNRASRIVEEMERLKIVSSESGSKARKVLMSKIEFEDFLKS